MPIPKDRPKPVTDLNRQLILLYGQPKFGKSTLAAQFPDSIFLATEAGLGSLDAMRWERPNGGYVIDRWAASEKDPTPGLLEAAREVVKDGRFKTLIIDTIGNACALADRWICERAGEEYRGDGKLGFGKGNTMVINEIKRFLTGLSGTGIGVVLIAHSMTKEVTTPAGEVTKTRPHLPGDNKSEDLYNLVLGMCDLVLLVDQEPSGRRVLRAKPKMNFDAGDRSGRVPETIDCTYAALASAFAVAPVAAQAAPAAAAAVTTPAQKKA